MPQECEYKTARLKVWMPGQAMPAELKDRIPAGWKADIEGEDTDILIGYASTFGGPPDFGGDIVVKGAFTQTIQQRIPAGKVVLTDGHSYDARSIVGLVNAAVEDDHGLLIKARFSKAASAQEVKLKCAEGIIGALSIGYKALEVDWQRYAGEGEWNGEIVRLLKVVRLDEVAVTAMPMNEECRILSVKACQGLPFEELPLAPLGTLWDAAGAAARVRAWAKATDKPNAKSMAAYLGFERGKAESMDACVGLFADVVEGQLKAVPAALYGLAAEALEARTTGKGAERFPDSVLNHAGKYLTLLGEPVPWKQAGLDIAILRAKAGNVDRNALARAASTIKRYLSEGAGPGTPPTPEPESEGTKTATVDPVADAARLERLAKARTTA